MKRIMVAAAGGSPSTNFVRSLRAMEEKSYLIGVDADPLTIGRAETDVRHLVPYAREAAYIPVLNQIIDEEKVEFLHAQNDIEVEIISNNRDTLRTRTFLPSKETIDICLDKFATFDRWQAAGIKVPETLLIKNQDDLKQAFTEFGPRIWLRNIKGAAGNGSFPTSDLEEGVQWIEFQKGWGHFTAARCLTPQTVTWMSLWNEGELVVAQGRKRLSWELGNRAPSGVTGVTGTGITYGDPTLDALSEKAIFAIDEKPHGIFSVDFTYDQEGIPNPTEINIGRFFTTHFFFTKAGLNMPELLVKLAYGEALPPIPVKYNPLPNDLAWIRGVDFEPTLTTVAAIKAGEQELAERLKKITP